MLTLLPGAALAAEAGGEGTEILPPAAEAETGGEAETGPSYGEEAEAPPASGAEDPVPAEPAPEEPAEEEAAPAEPVEEAVLLAESTDGYTLASTEDELNQAIWGTGDSGTPVYIRLTADIELSNPLSLYGGKSVTLDLGGHKLSIFTEYTAVQVLQIYPRASLTLRNGRVDGGDGQAVNVYGGTLAMENVTVTAALPVLCTSSGNAAGETVPGTITYIKGCRLEGTPSSADAQRGYDGLNVDNGRVELIENTYIQGGHCGIGVHQGSSIGTITTNPNGGNQRTTITGGNTGIFVDIGTIGTIENCDILYTGTTEDGRGFTQYGLELRKGSVSSVSGCKIDGIMLSDIGQNGDEQAYQIQSLSDCEIQGPVVVYGGILDTITNCRLSQGNNPAADALIEVRGGDVGTIENCTLDIPSIDGNSSRRPGNGISVNAGRVGTIAGCQFTSSADQLIAIFIGEASVDEITGNTFTVPASSTSGPCNMLNISLTGTLGKLGANTAGGTGGRIISSGIIKEITAPGAWDEAERRFTAASGNWSLLNSGTIGEAVRASTEAELRSALEGGSVHVVLGADIGLSAPLVIDGNLRHPVLNLGGYTLTGTVNLSDNATLIQNGTIAAAAGSSSPTVSVTDASLEMEQVAVTGIRPLAVSSADDGDSSTRGTILSLQDCQIIGSPVPAGEQNPEDYCGILIEGFANVNVQGSTVTGGFVGIRQNAAAPQDETGRYTALYIYGSDVGSLSALPGACAIENVSGVIEGVYNTTLRTAGGANTAAIRNREAGVIRSLSGDIRTDGSNAIYSEGAVEAILGNGEWKNNHTVFEADAGWALYLGSSSSLTALDTPTNVRWGDGTNLPTGAMAWDMGENEGSVAVKVWRREGTYEALITSYILEVSREAGPVLDENLLFDTKLGFPWSPGTYYFTVQALGDYVTAASSTIAVSPDWTYTMPGGTYNALQIEVAVPWNGQQIAFKSVDADLAKTYAYKTELLCNVEGESEARLIATNIDRARSEQTGEYIPTSLTLEWFKGCIKEAGSLKGEYYLYVTAISMDVNTAWNGEYWTQHTIYPSDVQGTLEDLVSKENTPPQEIQEIVAGIGAEKLLDAMAEENGGEIAGMLQQLDDKMGITTRVEVAANVPGFAAGTVSVVGAALNADMNGASGETGSVEVTLKIEAASATAPAIPEGMYDKSVSFSMTLTNVKSAEKLAVPVRITLPVPDTITDTSKLVIFHHHGGTTETVPFQIIEKDGKTFAAFCVAGFSDFTMTESVSGVSLGRLTVNEDGSGSVRVTAGGSGFTLAVASYDGEGKMLGMQTFSPAGEGTVSFRLPAGQTVKAFALAADGSWTPVSLAAAG